MTYINEMNRFWRVANALTLSANAKILYLYLLHESNVLGLKSTFCLPVASVKAGAGLNDKQYRTARNILLNNGLADFEINQANHTVTVKMCLFGSPLGLPTRRPNGYPNGHPNGYPKNSHPFNNIKRQDEIRQEAQKTYDPEAFFAAAVARGERKEEG